MRAETAHMKLLLTLYTRCQAGNKLTVSPQNFKNLTDVYELREIPYSTYEFVTAF